MPKTNPGRDIILASGSARRRELLDEAGITFRIEASAADETVQSGESPQAMVERLALIKARTVVDKFPQSWVIGADTTVAFGNEIFGKPTDAADALRMLSVLQGSSHQVWSAFAIVHRGSLGSDTIEFVESACTEVVMYPHSRAQLEEYIASGEPMDKAGSYAIQGKGAYLMKAIRGSYTNVVGLDIAALVRALRGYGVVT